MRPRGPPLQQLVNNYIEKARQPMMMVIYEIASTTAPSVRFWVTINPLWTAGKDEKQQKKTTAFEYLPTSGVLGKFPRKKIHNKQIKL